MLGGVVALALIAAQVFSWRNLIDRIPRGLLLGQLHFYCVLIALGASVGGGVHSPYRLLYFLPVTFTAVFFTGWLRYSTAVIASGIDSAVLRILPGVSLPDQAVRCVMVLLVAGFAGEVADMLRAALRDNRSLHAVLEAASGDPLNSELASIGLDAAMSVVRWDAGGVVLVENGFVDLAVVRGVSSKLLPFYADNPVAVADAPLVGPIAATGKPFSIDDLSTVFPPEHPVRAEGVAAMTGVPIQYHGEVLGVLVVAHFKPRHPDEHDLDRLHSVAGQLGLALGNARAYRVEKEVAENLRELNRRKDEFLANVSHELRTPATAIKLVASTLRHNASRLDPAQIDELYETIERRSTGLIDLINNLLDEAVADAGETRLSLEALDWREALVRWAEMAQLHFGREISVQIPAGSVSGTGDVVKLERVVSNLLSNAAKFSEPDTPIVIALSADDRNVMVEVTDEGRGIAPSELPRVFDRFFQVDAGATREAGGFGIGLSLTHHFVEAHGGTIDVRSRVAQGTTFTVTIPRQPLPTSRVNTPSPAVTDSGHG